jgi:hypothetical protein
MCISTATEGYPDEIVVRSVCRIVGISIARFFNTGGKANLDKRLSGYNEAAKLSRWLVLRDLDLDAECAADLRRRLMPQPAPHMAFRLAVRSVEAWLMADAGTLAPFLRVSRRQIPMDPEGLDRPKEEMVRLASRSRSRAIREDMVPRPGSGARQGPGYAARLAEFAEIHWRPDVAAQASDSLSRCIVRLRAWT